jgi:hypothetical protein
VVTMSRLRRNSASSLPMTAPTRAALALTGPPPVVTDQLEVDVLQRVPRLSDRQHASRVFLLQAGFPGAAGAAEGAGERCGAGGAVCPDVAGAAPVGRSRPW